MLRKVLILLLSLALTFSLGSGGSIAVEVKAASDPPGTNRTPVTEPETVPAPLPADVPGVLPQQPSKDMTLPPPEGPAVSGVSPESPAPSELPSKEGESVKVTISFAGDCTIGTDTAFAWQASFPQVLAARGNDLSYFFGGVGRIFEADDISVVNLETTLTRASKPAVKKFRFKGDPSYAGILKKGSVEAVSVANNHTMDYMQQGFDDTLDSLEAAGIGYFGRERILSLPVKGVKVAFIGYTAWDTDIRTKLKKSLEKAEKEAGISVVALHWGQERVYKQNDEQIALAHFCIDNGADAVIGHHPHVLQGTELYRGRYIAYSLGNFCFGGNSNPADKDTMIFQNVFEMKSGKLVGTKAQIIPCSISSSRNINDYRPSVLEGEEANRVLAKIKVSEVSSP